MTSSPSTAGTHFTPTPRSTITAASESGSDGPRHPRPHPPPWASPLGHQTSPTPKSSPSIRPTNSGSGSGPLARGCRATPHRMPTRCSRLREPPISTSSTSPLWAPRRPGRSSGSRLRRWRWCGSRRRRGMDSEMMFAVRINVSVLHEFVDI